MIFILKFSLGMQDSIVWEGGRNNNMSSTPNQQPKLYKTESDPEDESSSSGGFRMNSPPHSENSFISDEAWDEDILSRSSPYQIAFKNLTPEKQQEVVNQVYSNFFENDM